mgnify:CR=1 FL=1
MSKIAVVYWSGTGNTEAMANLVAEGATDAGAEAEVISCADFSADKAAGYDAIAPQQAQCAGKISRHSLSPVLFLFIRSVNYIFFITRCK